MKPCSGMPGFSHVLLVGSVTRNHCGNKGFYESKADNVTERKRLIIKKSFFLGVPCTGR